jgi:hypothetical protein
MSKFLLSVLFSAAAVGNIIATLLIRAKIITEINSKRDPRSQISFLDRDFLGTLDSHRRLYPKSFIRVALILTLGLSVVFCLCITLVQGSQQ